MNVFVKVVVGLLVASTVGGVGMFLSHGTQLTKNEQQLKTIEKRLESHDAAIDVHEAATADQGTRITVLEVGEDSMREDVKEIKADVKKLLEAR